jgi:hypothetical protein
MRPPHHALPMLVAVTLWLVVGFDGRLHWDEPQYLYSGAYFSTEEILAGDFQPSTIAGFTVSRFAHIILIKWLAGLFGIGGQLLAVVMISYVASLLIFFFVGHLILRELAVPATDSAVAMISVMFSPVGFYLAYKTLPDVPALMWSSLAVLAAIRWVRDGRRWVWFPIGALSLAMAALTKHVLVWTFVSFAAAAMLAGPVGMARAVLDTERFVGKFICRFFSSPHDLGPRSFGLLGISFDRTTGRRTCRGQGPSHPDCSGVVLGRITDCGVSP